MVVPPGTENGEILVVPIRKDFQEIMVENIDSFYVKVMVQKSPYFYKRDGLDIYSRIDIDPNTAIYGGNVPIRGLHYSPLKLNIPVGISSHQNLTITGEGIKIAGLSGDHYVEIGINMANLTAEDEAALRDLENDKEIEDDMNNVIHPVVLHRDFHKSEVNN